MNEGVKRLGKRVSAGLLALSSAGLLALAGFEGFSEKAYIPVEGDVPTIGYGHTDPTGRLQVGDLITKDEALLLLQEDVREAEAAVQKCVKVPLYPREFDSYVSLSYNIGERAFCNSTLVRRLNSGDYYGACSELKRWVYSGGKKYRGLEIRRKAEELICKEGVYPKKQ